jgi:hypothetical protein
VVPHGTVQERPSTSQHHSGQTPPAAGHGTEAKSCAPPPACKPRRNRVRTVRVQAEAKSCAHRPHASRGEIVCATAPRASRGQIVCAPPPCKPRRNRVRAARAGGETPRPGARSVAPVQPLAYATPTRKGVEMKTQCRHLSCRRVAREKGHGLTTLGIQRSALGKAAKASSGPFDQPVDPGHEGQRDDIREPHRLSRRSPISRVPRPGGWHRPDRLRPVAPRL